MSEIKFQAHSEWRDVPDIIKITFKGVYQVLRNQADELIHNEQVRENINASLNQKANFADVKKTMLEVVQNIESRASISEVKRLVDERVSKIDLSHMVKDKVSFDDLYQYIKNGNMHNGNKQVQNGGNQKSVLEFEQELVKLRQKLEETLNIVSRIQPPISLSEIEERLSEKANKQSVA